MSMRVWRFLVVLNLCVLGSVRANPADLDVTFNPTGSHRGTATAASRAIIAGTGMVAQAAAVQSDGKIVVVGFGQAAGIQRLIVARVTATGVLDTSFGSTGSVAVTIDPFEVASGATSVVLQSDGKIVIGGFTITATASRFAVIRLTATGVLDPIFNGTGIVKTAIVSSETAGCLGVALQPDGKIVASGFSGHGSVYKFAVLRLNSNGLFDTSFGGTGKVVTKIDPSEDSSFGRNLALQADGKIVVGGTVTMSGVDRLAGARFNTDGSVDITFSTQIDPSELQSEGFAVAIQANGKIVIGGNIIPAVGDKRFAGARFNTNGSVDTTFFSQIDPGESNSACSSLALQSDGKIVEVGTVSFFGPTFGAVARFNTDGSVDALVTTTIDLTQTQGAGNGMCIQSDGKIIEVGSVTIGAAIKCALARYNTNMSLDSTFNGTGTESLDLLFDSPIPLQGNALAWQSNDGALVVGGAGLVAGAQSVFAVARFTAQGVLDLSFNSSGLMPGTVLTEIEADGTPSVGNGILVQSDGKIVLAGAATVGGQQKFAVARYMSDGTLDASFNAGGSRPGTVVAQVNILEDSSRGTAVALQLDGKIVVAGVVEIAGIAYCAVIRFKADGTVDATNYTKIDPTETGSQGLAIAIQSDGKIVVCGMATVGGSNRCAVARFNTNLSVDTTWSATINPGETASVAYAVVIQGNGKIIIAGSTTVGGHDRCAVARFNTNGSLDTTFNVTGILDFKINVSELTSSLNSVQLQVNGKIVAAGFTSNAFSHAFALARLESNGILDPFFGNAGTTSTFIQSGEPISEALGLVVQPDDGKIVAAGYSEGGQQWMAVARFLGGKQGVSINSWLKTIYAEGLGFAPGECG